MKFLPHSCFFTSIFCSKCCFTFVLFGVAAVLLRLWTPMRSCVRVENPLRRNPWRTTMETFAVALAIAILFRWKASEKRKRTFPQLKMKGSPNWLRRHLQECSYRISCNTHYHYPMFVYFSFIHFLKFSQNPKIKKTYTKRLSTTKFYNDIFCVYMHACIYVQQYIIIYTVYSIYSIHLFLMSSKYNFP